MAVFRPGAAVGAISGNLGGICFSNPSGSAVVRTRRRSSPITSKGATTRQAQVQTTSNDWKALSNSQRSAWRTYAEQNPLPNRVGVRRAISGYQAFSTLRALTFVTGVGVNVLPNIVPDFVQPTNIGFSVSVASGISVTFDNPGVGIDVAGLIYARPLYRDTPVSFNNAWTLLGAIRVTNVTSIDITSEYAAKFPLSPILGQFIALRWAGIGLNGRTFPALIGITETLA